MSCIAIYQDDDLPKETEDFRVFEHTVGFMEVTTESVLQICLNCATLKINGLSSDPFYKFTQLFSLGISIISVLLQFSKVCMKFFLLLNLVYNFAA